MVGESLAKSINPSFIREEKRFKTIEIQDIPVMFGEDGSIVCIPKEEETFSIGIVGTSGSGKSLLLQRIAEHIYYLWEDNVAIMNDVSEETYKWTEPMHCKEFEDMNLIINQEPCPLPIIFVFPYTKDLKIKEDSLKNRCYIKIVLPFSEIIEDIGFFIKGVNPEFDMGRSGMYINDIAEDLSECETVEQVRIVLDEKLPGSEGKDFKAMRVKIKTAFESLFKEEILDISNPELYTDIKVKFSNGGEFEGNPFSVIMKAGVIPSFITCELQNKKYKSEIMAYHINSIFQNNLKHFPNKKTFLIFDELTAICQDDKDAAGKALGNVSARGRINNVGLIYATQFYNKIPLGVKGARLNYLFAFSHSNSEILREIASDFDLDNKTKERIKKLKKYEVIAMTKNKFICYRDDERWEIPGPIRGRLFFPLSNHKKANSYKNV